MTPDERWNRRLQKLESRFLAQIAKKDDVISDQSKKIKALESRLAYYENPHTPPSFDSLMWKKQKKQAREQRKTGDAPKRGGKKNHKGRTRIFKNPTKEVTVAPKACTKCGSVHLKKTRGFKKCVAAIPEIPKYYVEQWNTGKYECNDCSHKMDTRDDVIEGSYHPSVIRMIMMLYGQDNMSLAGIRQHMNILFKLDITEPTIQNIIERGTKRLVPVVSGIETDVMESKAAGIDETSVKIEGSTGWIWIMRTPTGVLVIVTDSRGAKMLKKLFGEYDGKLVTDGYRPYAKVFAGNKRQRCMAHLARDAKMLHTRKIKGAEKQHNKMGRLFHDAK